MTNIPAARFEETATARGTTVILNDVGAFVKASGVDTIECDRIAHTLATILEVAGGHALARGAARIAVVADVMPRDVQIIVRLCPGERPTQPRDSEPDGGLEVWISFPRDRLR